MAHDESGSIPESALSPATRALATGATANPSPNQRASAYALQIGLQSDPPGAWAGNVWEQYSKYRGIVSLAIRPYVHAMRAAKISVLRRKSNVRKSLGGSGHYSRDDEYEPVEADHPLAQIVEEPGGPNGAWGFGDELAFLALQRHITGVGYAWCPPNTDGKPVRFFALATGSVTPGAPPGSPEYPQGSYIVNPYMGWVSSTSLIAPTAPIPAEQVPAFKEFNPYSRTLALSTLATGAKEIDLLDAITDFRWTYFNKGVALDTFIQLPGADDDAVARFKEQFKQEHVGSRNARKVLVAGGAIGDGAGAAKIQQLAPNAKDLDFPSGFEQSLGLVLAFFNVPKILAGFGDTSNYATYHGELKRFYDIAITPFCRDLSAFLSKSLARAWSDYAGEYRIEVEPQIPADVEAERAAMQFGIGQGAITVNEWRKANGMKPVEGGDVPASIYQATLQQKMQPQPQPGAPGDPAAMGGTSAAPQDAPPSEEQGAISDAEQAPEGDAEQAANLPLAGDDSEQGVQDATLQAAFAALGMGGTGAGRDDEQPVMKAAAPVNKPGSARSPHRAEGEIWTTASGKRYTKKNGKIVPAPQQRTQKPASSQPVAQPQQGGTGAAAKPADAPFDRKAAEAKLLAAGLEKRGLTPQMVKQWPDKFIKVALAQLELAPAEQAYAEHAATVPASTPTAKTTLQRAHEWSDAMAAKHAAKVAQHLGVPPATAQKILGKAIRQIAEHALKNGGRASGTLTVGGKQLKVGVGKPGEAAARAQQPAESGTSAAPSGEKQAQGKPGATRPAPLPGGTTAAPSRPAGVPLKPPTPEELGFGQDAPPRPEAQDRPGTAAGAPTPAEPDWEQIANSPNRNRGTGLKRPSLLRRLRDSKLGRLGSRALEAYKDAVDRGIIVAGTDEERADARERRAARRVAKAFDPWDVADELRDAGEYELAADLEDLLETDDLPTIRKALADLPPDELPALMPEVVQKADPAGMNTLAASEGGFLVPEETKPKKKKRKVPVAALVAKAIAAPLPGDWSVPAPLPVQPVRVLEQQQAAPVPPAPPMVVNLPADQPAPMVVNLPADPTPVTVNVGAPQVAPVPVTVVMPQTAPQFTNGTVERAEDGSWLIRREFKGVDGAAVAPTVLKARRTAEGAWQVEQVAE